MIDHIKNDLNMVAGVTMAPSTHLKIGLSHHYNVVCYDKDGNLKWTDDFDNLVVTTGLNKYLSATLVDGLASPAWYVGLKDGSGDVLAADTLASNTNWNEITPYSNSTRPAWVPGAISGGSVSSSAAVFNMNSGTTVYGAFMASSSTKSETASILLGAGNFTTPRAVLSGDILNVTITITMTAA